MDKPADQFNLIGYSYRSILAAQTANFYARSGCIVDQCAPRREARNAREPGSCGWRPTPAGHWPAHGRCAPPANTGGRCTSRVHRVMRRGGHAGPVRLHEVEVQHPRLAAHRVDVANGLIGRVGRLGMRLRPARRQMHIAHVPPVDDVAAGVHRRDHVAGPRVGTSAGFGAQKRRVAHLRTRRMLAVVARAKSR